MDPLNSTVDPLQGQGQNRNSKKVKNTPVIIQCNDVSYQSTLLTTKDLTEINLHVDNKKTKIYLQLKQGHPEAEGEYSISWILELPTISIVSCKMFCLKESGLGVNFIFFEVEQNLELDTDLKMKLMKAGALNEQGPKGNYFRKARKLLFDNMLKTNDGYNVINSSQYMRFSTGCMGRKKFEMLKSIFQQKFSVYHIDKQMIPNVEIMKSTTTSSVPTTKIITTPASTSTINNLSNEILKSYNFFTSTIHFGTFVCTLKNDVYIDLNGLQEVNITIKIHEDKEKFINIPIDYDPMNEYILTPNGAKNWILFIRHVDPALPKKISEQLKIPTLMTYYCLDPKESKKNYISLVVDSRSLELRNHAFNLLLDIFKYAENFKFNDRNLLEIPYIPGITQEGYQSKASKEPENSLNINNAQDNDISGAKVEVLTMRDLYFPCPAIQFGGLMITNKNKCSLKFAKSGGIDIEIVFHIKESREELSHKLKYSELNEYILASKEDKTWMLIFLQNTVFDFRTTGILNRLHPEAKDYYNPANCNIIFHSGPRQSTMFDKIKKMFKPYKNFKVLNNINISDSGLVEPSEHTMTFNEIPNPFNFKTDSINFGSYSYTIPTFVQIKVKQPCIPEIRITMAKENPDLKDLPLVIKFKQSHQYILSKYDEFGWILFINLKDKVQYTRIVKTVGIVYKNSLLSTYYNPESEDTGKRYIALIATCQSQAERNEAFEKIQNIFMYQNNFKISTVTYIPNKDVEMEVD